MLSPHRRTLSLLVVLCLGHVLLISAQVQSDTGVPVLESAAFNVFARVQGATAAVADTGRGIWRHYIALGGAARENEDLRRRILELEGRLQEQAAAVGQVQSLEHVLGLRETLAIPTVSARVLAGSPQPGSSTITIDRGSADGIRPDMAVLSSRGVVGRVVGEPAAHASRVQLLIGGSAAAAARLESTGAGGIVTGGHRAPGDPPLRMEFVSSLVDVTIGERVLTSGQDGIYPQGLFIGTVERTEVDGPQRIITVQPAVDFSYIDLVLVLLSGPQQPPGLRP